MLHILKKRNIHTLAEFAASNVMLAFDYDGTLAPIASRPEMARMRPDTRRLLSAVSRRYPAVVISGRARDDLMRRVGSVPIWHVSGNHGLEPWGEEPEYHAQVRGWVAQLQRRLGNWPGIEIEDKAYSITVHFRHARDNGRALAAVRKAVVRLRGARTLGGKSAISVVPAGAPHKGAALERVRRLLACDTAIYVGDDDTDEDAFGSAGSHRLLAIRVGRRASSRAQYFVSTQQEVDELLRLLLKFRPLRRSRMP